MGDFSHLPVTENIENMLRIRELVGGRAVEIEGELGRLQV